MYKYLEVVAYSDNEVVRRIDVSGKTENEIEKIERGLNVNLNHNDYYIQETHSDNKLTTRKN